MSNTARVIKACSPQSGAAHVLHVQDFDEQARQILTAARQEAARVISAAKAELGKLREQSCRQGFAEGIEQGLNQGYKEGLGKALAEHARKVQAEWAELAGLVKAVAGNLTSAREQLLEQARRQMLQFALELAGKIVGQVAARDIEAARANLIKAMALADRGGQIVVQVNPNQLQRLSEHCRELAAELAPLGEVRLEGDETISPGGVRVLSRCGQIDATIETQLVNIAASLLGHSPQLPLAGIYESSPAGQARAREGAAHAV